MDAQTLAACNWYDTHYDLVFERMFERAERCELGDRANRVCRFCGKRPPEVRFSQVAHAIPQALGNRGLITAYECDACNSHFGGGIETDLGTWSMPRRTASLIKGQNGIPTLKKGSSGGWRVEVKGGRLEIHSYEDEPIFDLDEVNKKLTLTVTVGSYTPVAVYKAFVRIGLTLMPDSELGAFGTTLAWIRDPNHSNGLIHGATICHTRQNGPMPPDRLTAIVLRRKPETIGSPYAYLVLGYGNDVYQVVLPAPAEDASLAGQPFSMVVFPTPGGPDPARYGRSTPRMLDLTGHSVVKGEKEIIRFGYEHMVKVPVHPRQSTRSFGGGTP